MYQIFKISEVAGSPATYTHMFRKSNVSTHSGHSRKESVLYCGRPGAWVGQAGSWTDTPTSGPGHTWLLLHLSIFFYKVGLIIQNHTVGLLYMLNEMSLLEGLAQQLLVDIIVSFTARIK
jgi:hypothetical protein